MFAYAEQYKRSSIAKASRSTQFVSEVMVNEFHVARHCHPIVAQFLQNAIVMNQLSQTSVLRLDSSKRFICKSKIHIWMGALRLFN
jgi:hypothetical protein